MSFAGDATTTDYRTKCNAPCTYRLRTVESLRQSAIAHQWNTLTADVEAIERIVRHVELSHAQASTVGDNVRVVNPSPGAADTEPNTVVTPATAAKMIELIQQYADLSTTVEKLATKVTHFSYVCCRNNSTAYCFTKPNKLPQPVSIQVDFPTDDFPRETAQRLEVIGRCERYSHALAVKDQMLWTVIKVSSWTMYGIDRLCPSSTASFFCDSNQENERLQERLEEETTLCQEYASEMADWVEMTNSLGREVQRLREENEQLQLQLKHQQQHSRGVFSL